LWLLFLSPANFSGEDLDHVGELKDLELKYYK
jgi:hypothetical protein